MFNQYLSITKIFVDLYTYPDTYKIIEYNNENIITADIKKILSVLKFENPKVNYFIKLLKDIFKSDLLHRKYLVVLLNNLFYVSCNVNIFFHGYNNHVAPCE